MPAQPAPDEPTYSCKTCGRRFIKSSLIKHEPACKKLTKMQRKTFDSGKQRATGTDIPLAHIQKVKKEREKLGGSFPRPKTNWRERHEDFISAVSASKQVEHALKTGAPLPPPPKTSVNSVYLNLDPADCMTLYTYRFSDQKPSSAQNGLKKLVSLKNAHYIQCDYCGRNFSRQAAERHIPFCEEQSKRRGTTAKPQTRSNSLSRAARRSSEQPPATSSTKRSSRENSLTRSGSITRSDGRFSQEKPPPTGKTGRTNASSATHATRSSQLPTPVKRSSSASKVPPTSQTNRSGQSKSTYPPPSRYERNGYERAPKTSSTSYYDRAPKTSSPYDRPPRTSISTYERAPKTSSSVYEKAPKTASSPKTPKPKSRGQTSRDRRSLETSASRRSSSRKRRDIY